MLFRSRVLTAVIIILLTAIGFFITTNIHEYKALTNENKHSIQAIRQSVDINKQNVAVINERLINIQQTLNEIKDEIKK